MEKQLNKKLFNFGTSIEDYYGVTFIGLIMK